MRMNVAGVTAIGTREAYSQISGAVRAFARAALLCGSVKRRAQNHLGQLLRGFYFIESAWALQRRWQCLAGVGPGSSNTTVLASA
jgi:hypothetical protein